MRPAILVVLLALLTPRPAGAMHLRIDAHLVAWSSDGRSALLQERRQGPEGGGALAYLVLSSQGQDSLSFELSSDLNPGGAGGRQAVSEADCRARAGELAEVLNQKQFEGVAVDPARCSDSRPAIVTVSRRQLDEATASALAQGRQVKRWRWSRTGRNVVVTAPIRGYTRILEVNSRAPEAFLSPAGLMLVVFHHAAGDRRLVGLVAVRPDGALNSLTFRPLPGGEPASAP